MIVLWRVTTACNYACPFCAYDRRLDGARVAVDEAEALRFGRLLARWGGSRVLLSWIGGEPLLWRPVWRVSAALAAEGLALSATTNGSTLARADVQAAVAAHFRELTVSVDAPSALHNRLRGAAFAYERVQDGVRALRACAPTLKLRANIVLMRDTLAGFAEVCTTLTDWGIDEITINQLGGRDRPAFFPAQRLRPADIAALAAAWPDLRERLAGRGVHLLGDGRYLDRLRASAEGRAMPVADCAPGRSFLFVDEHGLISPCSFSGSHGVPIATLRTPADLDALPARFAAARAQTRPAACSDCPSTQTHAKFAA